MKIIGLIVGFLFFFAQQASAQNSSDMVNLEEMWCFHYQRADGVMISRDAGTFQSFAGQADTWIPDCASVQLPVIDFSMRTVLGLRVSGYGCSVEFTPTVSRDDAAKKVVLTVEAAGRGGCDSALLKTIWVSVPSIPADYEVIGTVNRTRMP